MPDNKRNTAAYAEIFNKEFFKEVICIIIAMAGYHFIFLGMCYLIAEIGVR